MEGQGAGVRTVRSRFPVDQAHDEPTAALLTQRTQVYEKKCRDAAQPAD
ncbi:hypothetical protein [Trichothermofontia sp.]